MAIIYKARGDAAALAGAPDPTEPPPISPVGMVLAAAGAAGIASALTVLYLGMASIMSTSGGFVASGGPYEIASPAPDWIWLIPVSIWTMLMFGGIALYGARRGWGESPLIYAWMGLFISLGWNFLRLGFDPPEFMQSTWGWIVSGVLFWIMGLIPAGFVGSWLIDVIKDARAGRPPSTMSGRPTRRIYVVLQLVGALAGVAGGNLVFGAVVG